jgi:hypothetical protein
VGELVSRNAPAVQIELLIFKRQFSAFLVQRPANQRSHSRAKFGNSEWFCQIVIGSGS